MKCLNEALKAFRLSVKLLPDIPSTKASTSGIGGIEKRNKDTNITSEKNISEAFNDLSELMEKVICNHYFYSKYNYYILLLL